MLTNFKRPRPYAGNNLRTLSVRLPPHYIKKDRRLEVSQFFPESGCIMSFQFAPVPTLCM